MVGTSACRAPSKVSDSSALANTTASTAGSQNHPERRAAPRQATSRPRVRSAPTMVRRRGKASATKPPSGPPSRVAREDDAQTRPVSVADPVCCSNSQATTTSGAAAPSFEIRRPPSRAVRWRVERISEGMDTVLLAAARRDFAEHGYDGTTVALLEKELGVARGAIFNYWPNNLAIFMQLAERAAVDVTETPELLARGPVVEDLAGASPGRPRVVRRLPGGDARDPPRSGDVGALGA